MTALLTVVASLAMTALAVLALHGLARYVGLARCMECRRNCPPWDAYCWRHRPDGAS